MHTKLRHSRKHRLTAPGYCSFLALVFAGQLLAGCGWRSFERHGRPRISYKSALFMMNRIRFAKAPDADAPKLTGTVEADETYVGGR